MYLPFLNNQHDYKFECNNEFQQFKSLRCTPTCIDVLRDS